MQEKTIGEKIREYRQKQGLTQDALAAELHVSSQAVSKWENGQTMPDISLLLPLSRFLGNEQSQFALVWDHLLPSVLKLRAAVGAEKVVKPDLEYLRERNEQIDIGHSESVFPF